MDKKNPFAALKIVKLQLRPDLRKVMMKTQHSVPLLSLKLLKIYTCSNYNVINDFYFDFLLLINIVTIINYNNKITALHPNSCFIFIFVASNF